MKRDDALLAAIVAELARRKLECYEPYPKQRAFHRAGATHSERLFMAGNQCLTPWTFVETDRGPVQIESILGEPCANVVALVDGTQQNARTGGWFLRGIEKAFRVVLDSGEFFDCSRKHQVLTTEGWLSLDRLVLRANGLRCWSKREDFQASCVEDGYLCGPQPHVFSGSGREQPRKQLDARASTLCWTQEDAAARTPAHIHACLDTDLQTIADGDPAHFSGLFEMFAAPSVRTRVLPAIQNIREFQRLRPEFFGPALSVGEEPLCQRSSLDLEEPSKCFVVAGVTAQSHAIARVVEPFLCDQRQENSIQEVFECADRVAIFYPCEHVPLVGGKRIIAVVPIGFQPILDVHVPGPNNYMAAGVCHHNCGKTIAGGAEWAMHATGRYPEWWDGAEFKKAPLLWAGSVTGESTRDNPQRILVGPPPTASLWGTGFLPTDSITGRDRAIGVSNLLDNVQVRHGGGGDIQAGAAIIAVKAYEKGREKWQGPTVDGVWFDEEPPLDIYTEGLTRTNNGQRGQFSMITFTPLLGMSNVVMLFLGNDTERCS